MQSCPKNVLTGPLTGDSKRSSMSSIAKESLPLPPVALALPLEPASATGPPSPARGSAGMPPPPSPAGATYQTPPTPKQEVLETIDFKPVEKKKKARVGKAAVRNTIAMCHQSNTGLLMCNPPIQQTSFTCVKREVESPKEVELKKEEPSLTTIVENPSKIELDDAEVLKNHILTPPPSAPPENKEDVQENCLGISEKFARKEEIIVAAPTIVETLEPCINTVAENVKVKNMKRKLSNSSEMEKLEEKEDEEPLKKLKVEKFPIMNGYKSLIKKSTTCIKINNGKKKLTVEAVPPVDEPTVAKTKQTKRKLSPVKEDLTNTKKTKASKPLTASNMLNAKHNQKENKDKIFVDKELIENKEPVKKSTKKYQVNSKQKKQTVTTIADSNVRSNVDKTIESVINDITRNLTPEPFDLRISEVFKEEKYKDVDKCKITEKCKEMEVSELLEKTEEVDNIFEKNSEDEKSKIVEKCNLSEKDADKCKVAEQLKIVQNCKVEKSKVSGKSKVADKCKATDTCKTADKQKVTEKCKGVEKLKPTEKCKGVEKCKVVEKCKTGDKCKPGEKCKTEKSKDLENKLEKRRDSDVCNASDEVDNFVVVEKCKENEKYKGSEKCKVNEKCKTQEKQKKSGEKCKLQENESENLKINEKDICQEKYKNNEKCKSIEKCKVEKYKVVEKCKNSEKSKAAVCKKETGTTTKKGANNKVVSAKSKIETKKKGKIKGKSKSDVVCQAISRVPRKSLHLPRWSNGWEWKGEPFEAKVFLNVSSILF